MTGAAQADDDGAFALQFRYQGEIGFDAWDISTNAQSPAHERVLFLANSTPQWAERNPSPWIRLDSEVIFSEQWSGRLKFRGAQNTDWRIDELNLNWAISPQLGLSAGVVDYKTSWCRPYDVESPWVRENDPFCTVRTTDQATGAAPGVQVYSIFGGNEWSWQSHIGVFDPLVFDYDTKEFSNTTIRNRSKVLSNRKVGAGMSLLHHHTATEFRLGLLNTQQSADWDAYDDGSSLFRLRQKARLMFVGLNFHPMPFWSVRLTHVKDQMNGNWLTQDENRRDRRRRSLSVENIFRLNSNNTLALAWSQYQIRILDEWRSNPSETWSAWPLDKFDNQIVSIAWRKDWNPWLFTSVQASRSESDFDFYGLGKATPRGKAIGVRVGLRF